MWEQLRRALKAKPHELVFGDAGDHIRVFSRQGRELEDLRTPEDNQAAADFILEHLRQFTENPDLHIVASIAGGRKTMGALLYAAMTLIGRETDRITHVLVDEKLEQQRDPKFYFPRFRAEAGGVFLADIPFVPLRNKFQDLGRMPGGFSSMVAAYARTLRISDKPVRIRLESNGVRVDGRFIPLSSNQINGLRFLIRLNRDEPELRSFQDVQAEFGEMFGDRSAKDDLRKWVSGLRTALKNAGSIWYPETRPHPLKLPPFQTEDGKQEDGKI